MKDEYNLNAGDLIKYINSKDVISIARQAELLGVSRGSFYYKPKGIDEFTLATMNEIDEVYTKRPYFGSRKIAKEIGRRWQVPVNRKRIQRLMREMGLEAIYPKSNLSKNGLPHPIYPYLLRGVTAGYPNHIWGTDITYIRLERGFLYMTAFMDWFSRFILSWKLSTTLTTGFVVDAAKEALNVAHPDITNSDQGVQFTSNEYLSI
ncbi:MAG: IS3 family transposase [Patescibacteria group bacterium]